MNQRITRVFVAALAAVAITSAQAATINFSGYTWTTYDQLATGQYSPGQANEYSGVGNTGTMTGRFGVDTYMITALTLNVGDTVSYDYFLSEESRDFGGDGASTWVGDSRAGFTDASLNWASGRVATYNSRWDQYFEGNNPNSAFYPRGYPWSIHEEWLFTSSTTATVTLTLNGELTPFATWNDTFADIGDIAYFRVGLWDSEQDVVLSNFGVTPVPEPSSLVLFGAAGGIAVLLRRRRA